MSAAHKGDEVYGQDDQGKGEFDFEPQFDMPDEISLKTACCCCFCGLDNCEDFMQVQVKETCLWFEVTGGGKCCQCMDPEAESLACCQGTQQCKQCSMTDQEKGLVCCSLGDKGICCCCAVGMGSMSCCDPIGAPDTCIRVMAQYFCIHIRSALPCDEMVPFEIGCCGFMCKEADGATE